VGESRREAEGEEKKKREGGRARRASLGHLSKSRSAWPFPGASPEKKKRKKKEGGKSPNSHRDDLDYPASAMRSPEFELTSRQSDAEGGGRERRGKAKEEGPLPIRRSTARYSPATPFRKRKRGGGKRNSATTSRQNLLTCRGRQGVTSRSSIIRSSSNFNPRRKKAKGKGREKEGHDRVQSLRTAQIFAIKGAPTTISFVVCPTQKENEKKKERGRESVENSALPAGTTINRR